MEETQGEKTAHTTRMEARGLNNNQEERACLENHGENLALYSKCNGSYVENETHVSEILQTEHITVPPDLYFLLFSVMELHYQTCNSKSKNSSI